MPFGRMTVLSQRQMATQALLLAANIQTRGKSGTFLALLFWRKLGQV